MPSEVQKQLKPGKKTHAELNQTRARTHAKQRLSAWQSTAPVLHLRSKPRASAAKSLNLDAETGPQGAVQQENKQTKHARNKNKREAN